MGILIHGGITALWVLLFARAFLLDGIFAWSIGLAYAGYDTVLLALVFWQTLGLVRPEPVSQSGVGAGPPKTLAVIVAARDEAAVLPTTLAALFDQAEPPDLVVVADDGSTDGTAALLEREYGLVRPEPGALSAASPTHPALRWLALPPSGKPGALNAAMEIVDTELVLTVDADTLLEPGAIAAIRGAFAADPNLVAATGILRPVCGPSLAGRFYETFQAYEYIRNFLSRYAWMRMDSLLLISGAFAGFRRAAVVEVGGFDPACLVEDYELIHRLRRFGTIHGRGWTTAVVGEARALTEAPATTGAFLRQRRRWFGGFLQTQFWYRDMIGNGAYGRLGLVMLPIKAADTMQPIYGLTAFAWLAIQAARGELELVNPVVGVIGAKIAIDYAFHLWSIHLYRRWTAPADAPGFATGLLVSLLEPFSFQLLRHLGAAWGWAAFLTGERRWSVPHRAEATTSLARRDPSCPPRH